MAAASNYPLLKDVTVLSQAPTYEISHFFSELRLTCKIRRRKTLKIFFLRLSNTDTVSHDRLISSRILNQKKQIMVDFGVFFHNIEKIAIS